MKKIFRLVGFSGLLTAVLAVGAVASFAQDPCADVDAQNALYQEVLKNYKSDDPATLQKAIDAGKQFLEKYGSCEVPKAQVDWVKPKIPAWEKRKADIEKAKATGALYSRFDTGFKASNWDEVFASGKEILAKEPDKLDVMIVLASIGFDQAGKKNNKYNDDAVNYAKTAIQKMGSGVTSEKYGLFSYVYSNKENATGWMNMMAGYITYEPKGDRKGALPNLYKATQIGQETKEYSIPYELIGRYFLGESTKLRDELKALAARTPPTTEDEKAKQDAEYKTKEALYYGTLDRALDGYTRAYKFAKPTEKTYKDSMYQKVKDIYSVRYQKDTGVDEYITATVAKPLTDPAIAVAPATDIEVKPDATTKTSASPATASPTPTKPAAAVKSGTTAVRTKTQ
jgi:hypothetical protein